MIISRNWLKEYVKNLPDAKEVAEVLTMHAFEIESVEKKGDDEIIDVKVLPNRAHDCLCHRGVGREVATLLNTKFADREVSKDAFDTEKKSDLEIKIDDSKLCPRYMGRRIENISVKDSPNWLKEKLENLGERSINNMVDITNYIMLDLGQPMHAFDADKVEGGIHVRKAQKHEKMELLGGGEIVLDESVLLIADEAGPLAIAGIKGGKRAEVMTQTKNIILESANFDPSGIRKTSQKLGIKNNSSKRYENGISPDLAQLAIEYATKLIAENASSKETKNYDVEDIYPQKPEVAKIEVSLDQINNLLGANLSEKEVSNILNRTGWIYKNDGDKFIVVAPFERLDLRIKEDLVEEIGRIYGYENIKSVMPEAVSKMPQINKNFYYIQKIKNILVRQGFSEVYNYAFRGKGEVEIENPMASDKAFLRSNLKDGLKDSLEMNARNAPLLGVDEVKIFEIGAVFTKESEDIRFAVGIRNIKKDKKEESEKLAEAADALFKELGFRKDHTWFGDFKGENVLESGLYAVTQDLPEPKSYDHEVANLLEAKLRPISQYPFILRDIAVWVPKGTEGTEVLKIILENAGDLLVNKKLFDRFEKDGKVSYAFNLVFQSHEKTLTDLEINQIMEKITAALNAQNDWQVR